MHVAAGAGAVGLDPARADEDPVPDVAGIEVLLPERPRAADRIEEPVEDPAPVDAAPVPAGAAAADVVVALHLPVFHVLAAEGLVVEIAPVRVALRETGLQALLRVAALGDEAIAAPPVARLVGAARGGSQIREDGGIPIGPRAGLGQGRGRGNGPRRVLPRVAGPRSIRLRQGGRNGLARLQPAEGP